MNMSQINSNDIRKQLAFNARSDLGEKQLKTDM
jgi:hypothetical protein